ncbi:peptidoglycan DD-metalloendopeptidase family protein [Paenibacillus athensensis]|uniref:M23ase beta-sheet core domain-containing protein n=1 Tax=Paenibacillus athensensis TaxID=1967502 RepID=A0A4Y8Q585_9BACL|nr:M23 family metallopeptidase [Paenibacillus athensensis]MCD1259573.1 peptidoglycan DD-metalloendopeptidase family protein [Paenibacillus athensensis]
MNLKRSTRQLTLLIIPEANRPVLSLRIPHVSAYAALLSLLLLLLVSGTLLAVHRHSTQTAVKLQAELSGANLEWRESLQSKDETIEELQNKVIALSAQAEAVQQQLAEVKRLRSELKSAADTDALGPAAQKAADAAARSGADGVGGAPHPVSQAQISELGAKTEAAFTALRSEMDGLKTTLEARRQAEQRKQRALRAIPSIWPTTSRLVTSSYGYRKDPFTHKPSFHSGIDFGARAGEPVYAAAAGTVVSAGKDRFRGNNVLLEHTTGLRTWYMHLQRIAVKQGDAVGKGDTIGLVGSTGRSTGPHLHYEVIKNGKITDPRPYLPLTRRDVR